MSGAGVVGHAGGHASGGAGERVVLSIKPSPWFVVIRSLWVVLLLIAVAVAASWALRFAGVRGAGRAVSIGAAAAILVVVWQILEWASRSYLVTDRRVVRRAGVLRRDIADLPLRNVQHVTVHRSLLERVLGVGTVGIATPGTAWTEVFFVHVDDPEEVMRKVRGAMDGEGEKKSPTMKSSDAMNGEGVGAEALTLPSPGGPGEGAHRDRLDRKAVSTITGTSAATGTDDVLVIGLVGGIGAGKSEVAGLLREMGALVIDSDKEAKEALDRPAVREALVGWWGPGVLDAQGRIDRREVARIVFERPEERKRLEGLVHPLVKARRADLIERARGEGVRVAVIDAPLLLEAGVESECDRVVFVDAPREERLRRVREGRGWDEGELERREKAQWPLERKRRESDDVIVNDGDREALRRRVAEVLAKARKP